MSFNTIPGQMYSQYLGQYGGVLGGQNTPVSSNPVFNVVSNSNTAVDFYKGTGGADSHKENDTNGGGFVKILLFTLATAALIFGAVKLFKSGKAEGGSTTGVFDGANTAAKKPKNKKPKPNGAKPQKRKPHNSGARKPEAPKPKPVQQPKPAPKPAEPQKPVQNQTPPPVQAPKPVPAPAPKPVSDAETKIMQAIRDKFKAVPKECLDENIETLKKLKPETIEALSDKAVIMIFGTTASYTSEFSGGILAQRLLKLESKLSADEILNLCKTSNGLECLKSWVRSRKTADLNTFENLFVDAVDEADLRNIRLHASFDYLKAIDEAKELARKIIKSKPSSMLYSDIYPEFKKAFSGNDFLVKNIPPVEALSLFYTIGPVY